MLRTLPMTRDFTWTQRLAAVTLFALLTALSARVEIEFGGPIPFTLQVLVVLLSGMVLGARDGALSQVTYLSLIAMNMPLDARMLGAAAFAGPTSGYLIAFVPAAFVAGWLVQHGAHRVWQRWLAGLVGVAVIYALGLALLTPALGMDFSAAWAAGAAPFLAMDLAKAFIAAGIAESGRAALNRLMPPMV